MSYGEFLNSEINRHVASLDWTKGNRCKECDKLLDEDEDNFEDAFEKYPQLCEKCWDKYENLNNRAESLIYYQKRSANPIKIAQAERLIKKIKFNKEW